MSGASAFLERFPVVTGVLVAVMLATFVHLTLGASSDTVESELLLADAREFYEQNPQVAVSPRNRQLLGVDFVDAVAAAQQADGEASRGPVFHPRMRERTQLRFGAIADRAFEAKRAEFPAWRLGVSPLGGQPTRHLTYAFVHENVLALAVTLLFLVVAGVGLESAFGTLLFGGLCVLGLLVPAVAYEQLGGSGALPLSGGGGLVAMLLGAYLVRGAGPRGFMLPGWLLLSTWAFVEYLFVRGIWIDNFDPAPFVTHGIALAVGIGAALAVAALKLEKKRVERIDDASDSDEHPALTLAERAAQQGRPADACDVLADAFAASPKDTALALAFWEAAREIGRAQDAARAVLVVIRNELRVGHTEAASLRWRELVGGVPDVRPEPGLLIRVAEALLDEGHPEDALDALHRAVEHPSGLATALAQRVVRVARDLDPALTQRAAAIALGDAQLDPATRDALNQLCADVTAAPPPVLQTPPAPVATPAERTAEKTRFPVDRDVDLHDADLHGIDLHSESELTDPELFDPSGVSPGGVGSDMDEVDPNALSIQSIERQFSGDLGLGDGDESADIERWNDPNALPAADIDAAAVTLYEPDAPGGDHLDTSYLDQGALSGEALSRNASDPPAADPAPAPEPTPPPIEPAPALAPSEARALLDEDITDEMLAEALPADLDIGTVHRKLKLLEGVPLGVHGDVLEVEIAGKGKSKVPFNRVEAVAVAAVSGLSSKPVLILDLVLNWKATGDESLKVIRLCSHQFNPRRLAPDADSALDALATFVRALVEGAGSTPLPSADAVAGRPFATFADLDAYRREVLMAEE